MKKHLEMRRHYKLNKEAKVGDKCRCPACLTYFVKESYQQVFCKTKPGTKCKDFYWNNTTETKRNNTTRISPANARYYAEVIEPNLDRNFDDDPGWDAHKGSF
jgi:hypothetical protein